MAVKPHLQSVPAAKKPTGRVKKTKQPTQKSVMQRVLVLKNGRRKVLEWRAW